MAQMAPRPTTYAAPGRPVQGPPQNVRQMQVAMQPQTPVYSERDHFVRTVKIGVVAALLTGLGYVGFKFVRKRMKRKGR